MQLRAEKVHEKQIAAQYQHAAQAHFCSGGSRLPTMIPLHPASSD